MNRQVSTLVLVLGASCWSPAFAGYYCDDYVAGVSSAKGAEIYINSFAGSGWLGLCSLTATVGTVTPEQCKTVYATLVAAQVAGKRVRIWFEDNLACNSHPAWSMATTWYFGPEILPD